MNPRLLRIAALPLFAAAASACDGGSAAGPEPVTPVPAERPLPQRAAERVNEGDRYLCANGMAVVVDRHARRAWATFGDGAIVELPRAESASKSGGDAFVGKEISALREGNRVRLHRGGDGDAVDCAKP